MDCGVRVHNIGEALTFVFTALVVGSFGWRYGWWVSALLGFLGVGVIWFFFKDKPADPGEETAAAAPQKVDKNQAQWNLLKEPTVWMIALASLFMYVSRYSINSWGIFFLENAKGYGIEQASLIISTGAICGIVGTVASGWLSDRFFDGQRGIPAILAGLLNALSVVCFLVVPAGWMFVDITAMVVFGVTIGALICYLGGLMAVDIAGRDAAGAALGVVGIASYAGAGTQDIISGFLIGANKEVIEGANAYDFLAMGIFWTLSALLSVLMTFLAWHRSKKRASRIS